MLTWREKDFFLLNVGPKDMNLSPHCFGEPPLLSFSTSPSPDRYNDVGQHLAWLCASSIAAAAKFDIIEFKIQSNRHRSMLESVLAS